MLKKWKKGIWTINRVFASKRTYAPVVFIERVMKTRKGYHVYARVTLFERIAQADRNWTVLALQRVLGSDSTRDLFDSLRIIRKERVFNLMFDYKNGYRATFDTSALLALKKAMM